jgi:HlyD family secretion protein
MRRIVVLLLIIALIVALVTYYRYEHTKNKDPNRITLYGNVDVRQVDLGFRVGGRVDKMFFEEGDYVPMGQSMAVLDKRPYNDLVREGEARVASMEASLNNAEILLKAREKLRGTGAISKEDYDNALASRDMIKANLLEAEAARDAALTNLSDTEIFAPTTGTILTRIREPGTIVRESDPIYTLSIVEPVWVRTYVAEPDLGKVYPGMEAEVYTDTPGAPVYKGHVGFISPVAEFTPKNVETTQLRTDLVYRIRVIADNPDKGLRQGMPVTVKLMRKPEEGK